MSETNTSSLLRTYHCKCHCGKFEFDFDHEPIEEGDVIRCNCSICHSRGYLFVYPKEEYLKFTKGSLEEMTSYRFGKRVNPHYFCPTCGSGPLEASTRPGLYGVNIRSVAGGIDWSKLKIKDLDGASR